MQNLLDREGLRRCRAVRPARVGVFAFAFVVAWLQADAVVFRPGASEIVIAPDACDTVLLAAEEASEFMGKSLAAKGPSKICLRLYNATGEVWYDNVRIEEMD